MSLVAEIKSVYPELESKDFTGPENKILVVDEGDGIEYIAKWDYDKPIPEGMKLGK
jgi:hypothetical protein